MTKPLYKFIQSAKFVSFLLSRNKHQLSSKDFIDEVTKVALVETIGRILWGWYTTYIAPVHLQPSRWGYWYRLKSWVRVGPVCRSEKRTKRMNIQPASPGKPVKLLVFLGPKMVKCMLIDCKFSRTLELSVEFSSPCHMIISFGVETIFWRWALKTWRMHGPTEVNYGL